MAVLAVAGTLSLTLAAENQSVGVWINAAEEKRLQEQYESYRKVVIPCVFYS